MSQPKIIFVIGPTASGKSAFALRLARQNNGCIINADAMQIYDGLPILSAQPSRDDQKAIPHRLYGILDPTERSSAGRWVGLAKTTIAEAIAEGLTPILVGGTGLYIRSLSEGIAEIPAIPDSVRIEVQQLYDTLGEENFRRELAKLDPETAARLARNDRQRLVRAFEVAKHTGKSLSAWQVNTSTHYLDSFEIESHLVMPPREELYAACDKRFLIMLDQGAIEEVQQFEKRNIDPTLPAAKTIGVRELGDFLAGKISREEAITSSQQATRNYAKRQLTWFRNQKLSFMSKGDFSVIYSK
jgi:tRNA dimethylallyltransferase